MAAAKVNAGVFGKFQIWFQSMGYVFFCYPIWESVGKALRGDIWEGWI